MPRLSTRLQHLDLQLPAPSAPVANYVSTVRSQNMLYISGQIPMRDGAPAYQGRLGVFVACTPDFQRQGVVANGASNLLVNALGEAGRHVRTAVGVAALPQGVAVEVDAVFELQP